MYSKSGLLTTIAWGIDGKISYALEGSVFIAGAVVQWLRDGLGIIRSSEDTEYFATKVKDSNGVYFVPAFVGLGTPYWDMYARGTIVGLTRDTKAEHIVRAALEGVAYQAKDVLDSMKEDTGISLKVLKVDGGAVKNNFLMQFQSDILQTNIVKTEISEVTALGAAFLAGLAVGYWESYEEVESLLTIDRLYKPEKPTSHIEKDYAGWKKAIERSMGWAKE